MKIVNKSLFTILSTNQTFITMFIYISNYTDSKMEMITSFDA